MEKKQILELVSFFNKLTIEEEDVTSEEERKNGQMVLIARYTFDNKTFTTQRLYYKSILEQDRIKNKERILSYFGYPVFWLDIDINEWPRGSNESDLEKIVIDEIANEGDLEFKTFLKKLANNNQSGAIQRFTKDGQPGQYFHNLLNNNHWHDLVVLIKAFISAGGNEVDKKYFSRLVFKWDGRKDDPNRPRSTLAWGSSSYPRYMISSLRKNIQSVQNELFKMKELEVFKVKPQVILQGPPGTGKTRRAQEIAFQMITGQLLPQDEIPRKEKLLDLENSPQYKFVQFHPAYSYEDFVRGISVKLTNDQPEYKAVDKTLAEFAKCAQVNLEASKRSGLVEDIPMEEHFQNFVDAIQDELENVESIPLNDAVGITGIKNEAFLYSGKAWKYKDFRMNFSDVLEIYQTGRSSRADVKQLDKVSGLAKQHANYFILMADRFRKFMASQTLTRNAVPVERKDFVLIIDEINRANLPSVLGELIYALEYRGRKVESIYGESKGKEIVIPENLYIIGTMNTADRSVGHIDYAIRRRFAFVHVGPDLEVLSNQPGKDLFNTVASFFSKEKGLLASDFNAEDVQLGHSYFLGTKEEVELKLEYEIKPILREYVKDGILTEAASVIIENLSLTPNDTQNPPASGAV